MRHGCGGISTNVLVRLPERQIAMIDAIHRKIRQGGDQAIAASRGEGKSALAERLALKYMLEGLLQFVLLLHSTGGKAADSLAKIKEAIETNSASRLITPKSARRSVPWNRRPTVPITSFVTGKRTTRQAYPAATRNSPGVVRRSICRTCPVRRRPGRSLPRGAWTPRSAGSRKGRRPT